MALGAIKPVWLEEKQPEQESNRIKTCKSEPHNDELRALERYLGTCKMNVCDRSRVMTDRVACLLVSSTISSKMVGTLSPLSPTQLEIMI